MKKMIKWMLAFAMVVGMAGCNKEKEEEEEVVEEEEVSVVTYRELSNPTDLLAQIYTDLMEAYESGSKDEVELAAAYFACDFFTWSNKSEREDIGGINLVLPDVREDFASYALRDYYVNFAELLEQNGAKKLPEVIDYKVVENKASDYIYEGAGYENATYKDITLQLTYKDSKVFDVNELKSEMTITLLKTDTIWYVVGVDYENA